MSLDGLIGRELSIEWTRSNSQTPIRPTLRAVDMPLIELENVFGERHWFNVSEIRSIETAEQYQSRCEREDAIEEAEQTMKEPLMSYQRLPRGTFSWWPF